MERKEFWQQYQASDRQFIKIQLSQADLHGAKLWGVWAIKADLSGACLAEVNLAGAVLPNHMPTLSSLTGYSQQGLVVKFTL